MRHIWGRLVLCVDRCIGCQISLYNVVVVDIILSMQICTFRVGVDLVSYQPLLHQTNHSTVIIPTCKLLEFWERPPPEPSLRRFLILQHSETPTYQHCPQKQKQTPRPRGRGQQVRVRLMSNWSIATRNTHLPLSFSRITFPPQLQRHTGSVTPRYIQHHRRHRPLRPADLVKTSKVHESHT